MITSYFKLSNSLGQFKAFKVNEVGDNGFYAEINKDTEKESFSANIYLNGQLADLAINNWTFSFHVEGTYSNFGNEFKINAIDPHKKKIAFYNTPYYRENNYYNIEEYVLCTFLDLISLYSEFEDAEIANRFNLLLRALELNISRTFRRYEDEREITPEVALTQAKFFKDYYLKHIESNTDSYIMDIIKESVNKVIEIYKDEIESYKIDD